MSRRPPVLDYRTPARERSLHVLADRIVICIVASFVTLLALFCIVGGFYQRADWIFGVILGVLLMFIAALLWKAAFGLYNS